MLQQIENHPEHKQQLLVQPELSDNESPKLKEETLDTGVIYKITNKTNGKFYVGKAFSYVKNGNQPLRKHGAQDRFYKHFKAAKNGSNECPLFYQTLKDSNESDWKIETLDVCNKKHLKEYETKYIKRLKSYLPEVGYNVFIADNKPIEGENKEKYESAKIASNRNRAVGGRLKRNNDGLPANIYKRTSKLPNGNVIEGYFVQIKIGNKLQNKAFMSQKDTQEQKLEKAKEHLAQLKKDNNLE